MKVYKVILCIALVAVFGFCLIRFGNFQSDEATVQKSPASSDNSSDSVTDITEFNFEPSVFTTRLTTAINTYRERSAVTPWTEDEALTLAAQTRASECSVLGNKSHVRSDGSPWFTVLNITENHNYSEITGISGHSPDDLLRSWVNSESINNELLSTAYTSYGIGCEAIGGTVYCVLILYKP